MPRLLQVRMFLWLTNERELVLWYRFRKNYDELKLPRLPAQSNVRTRNSRRCDSPRAQTPRQ